MRILYLVHQFMPELSGGTERVTLNLARAAQADGHHAEVVTLAVAAHPGWRAAADGAFTAMVEGVPVGALGPPTEPQFVQLGFDADPQIEQRFTAFLAARPAFDVVHVMHPFRMLAAVEVLARRHIPYIVSMTDFFAICHRINLVRRDGALCAGPQGGEACRLHCQAPELPHPSYAARFARLGAILKSASAVVAVSDYVAGRVRAAHPDLPVLVVNNGVDLLSFAPPAPRVAGRPLTLLYVGTVSQAKGALVLVRAFARAAPAGMRLRVVGPCYDEAFAARLAEEAKGADISLEGAVEASAIPALIADCDLLCVPSQVPEAFSLALHEGFAAGLPALVSDRGNPAVVVAGLSCGRVIPAGDEDAWAAAIAEIAGKPGLVESWKSAVPLPFRIEEEAFLYGQLYRGVAGLRRWAQEGVEA